jgi:uncharacterized membrane protein (DUF485 family)
MSNPENQDLTPLSGGPADVAPLGRTAPKPDHEKTATEDTDGVDWDAIAATSEFKDLLKAKARFIVPATVFFIVYYFALPVLVGFFPETMKAKIGPANLAYLFALSQFFAAWIIAILYSRVAAKWDRKADALLASTRKGASK